MEKIDKKKPEHADIPASLEGEVLLERTYDSNGNPTGFLTCPVELAKLMRDSIKAGTIDNATLETAGWQKYKDSLLTFKADDEQ